MTVSIGVAVPCDGEPDDALVGRADRALYRVKGAGRDGVAARPVEAAAASRPLEPAGVRRLS